jgi:hypothetical protein
MERIIIDEKLAAILEVVTTPVELCDAASHVIGRFIPAFDPSEYVPVRDDISDEELDRRLRSNEKRYTTAEVLAHLEKL